MADIITAPMVIRLLKLPFMAFSKGHIYGQPITRNPIAWIPFFVLTPVVLVLYLIVCVIGFLLSPIFIICGSVALYLWKRRTGTFSDQGITFRKAYAGRTVSWSEIREVIRCLEPKNALYEIVCIDPAGNEIRYLMPWTQDDDTFERVLHERGIPLRISDWRTRADGPTS